MRLREIAALCALAAISAPLGYGLGYHLSRVQLRNIFAMGLLGTLIGGFILGYVGDRIGRRPALILATGGFGILVPRSGPWFGV